MRKLPQPSIAMEEPPDRRKRRALLAIALGLLFAPFVYETSLLCAARWRALYGPVVQVDTPFLDRASQILASMSSMITVQLGETIGNVPWRPMVVLPLAFVWALWGCWILRRK